MMPRPYDRSRRFGVWSEPDGSGFYAGLEESGRIVWRSLTTKNEGRADRWLTQGRCHGVGAHTKTCPDCLVKDGDA